MDSISVIAVQIAADRPQNQEKSLKPKRGLYTVNPVER